MKQVTTQEVFDKVVNHLLTQNKRSTQEGNPEGCMYRVDGLQCAVGCLIPDNLYNPYMDNQSDTSIEGLLRNYGFNELFDFEVIDLNEDKFVFLLSELQYIHDHIPPTLWEIELQVYAKRIGLKFNYVL